MSGHSKWSSIKHKKGAADKKRGQLFSKLSRAIIVAAREGGGDPSANLALANAIEKAKSYSMPKDNIDRAIERGKGAAGGDNYDEISYEGFGPGGIAFIIQAMTDNRNRTVGEVRAAMTRGGGDLGADGSVGWMFDNVGLIVVNPGKHDEDDVAMMAIDAGATEFESDGESMVVYTEPQDLHKVQESLSASGLEIESAELSMKPKDPIIPEADLAVKVIRLVERLEDLDDVQTVYTNLEISDDVLAQVS